MSAVNIKDNSRLADLINYKLKVFTQDGKVYIGELLAFDKFMNLILSDCVEERIPKNQLHKLHKSANDIKVEKRSLGLTILRGENILTTVVEDKPTTTKKERVHSEKQQDKAIKKQKKQNSSQKKSAGVSKPDHHNSKRFNQGEALAQNIPQPRKFQPPPGFKRR
ncbi:small nuclear ribonucleoprotein-associated protein B [Monosporozyma servazzii]